MSEPKMPEVAVSAAESGTPNVGDLAPKFSLKDQTGAVVTSDSLKGAPYVLYFYPKDNTPGCTQEACDFRDLHPDFTSLGVAVFGVSPDSEKSHAGFAQKFGLPFRLLADVDKELCAAYGVWAKKKNYGREYWGVVRSTFVIDRQGKVSAAFPSVRVKDHVPAVLRALEGA